VGQVDGAETNGCCWGVVVTPPYLLKLKTGNCDFILDVKMIADGTLVELVTLLVTCGTGCCSLATGCCVILALRH